MEAIKNAKHSLLTQVTNNTTYWIGHRPHEAYDHYAGQTFISPTDGVLDNIQIYADMVQYPGNLLLTLHSFDPEKKLWGLAIGSATVSLTFSDQKKWIFFSLPGIALQKQNAYGFRLQSSEALLAVGEAAGDLQNPPFSRGLEWTGTSDKESGHFFSYFSLAFKVEVV